MTIGGKAASSANSLDVCNPATGQVFAAVPDAGAAELESAITAARSAFPAWRDTAWADRAAIVNRIGETIAANAAELAAMLTREQGKPAEQAQFEVMAAAQWCQATASLTLPDREIEAGPGRRQVTRYVPIGVVAGISPWNFPVVLSIWKIAPALLAGNTLVLKPSPFTPMTVLRIGELVRDFVPAGVLNIITGGDALGPLMTSHPGFDKVSFTGSTATGRRVMANAASTLKRLTLELGGNDAAIVMPDVNVPETAEKLFWSAFTNSGQVCVATKRAYVHNDIYDAFRDELAKLALAVPMGDGSQQGTALGPIQNKPQYDRVKGLLADCEANGYQLLQGEAPEGDGLFVPVTLVDNPPEDSRIVQEEQFGPILPLVRFTDVEDAIAKANNTDMGLAGTVWSADMDAAMRIAERMDTGNVWINEGLALSPFAAFGGRKQSGMGVENGIEGLMAYTDPKTFLVTK
ncbi:aldehyde dehydrogenase family protein [Novosphingobium sp. ERN07]|nr:MULTISPECIES: aldehyde dehydrogenase family protein [unclassified Novosphingobium]AXU20756.1 aldehyde dehydrogenase [Novosphingobium sp. THN1]NLR41083.1 aldehyde dehydrogenase family protein [Novosphingobium sp. ERW19]NLR70834.1 aldehyde dehydrogenase family protein [Novosphingobium sp. ERN07]